jgi:hypothetical protein
LCQAWSYGDISQWTMSSKDTWAIFVGDLFKPQCFTCHSPWVRCPSSPFAHLAQPIDCFMFRLGLTPSLCHALNHHLAQANEIKMLYRTYAELVAASSEGSTDG